MRHRSERLVLGFGGCVDLEAQWDAATLTGLAASLRISMSEADPDVEIRDLRSLLCCIFGFLAAGRGGERRVKDRVPIEEYGSLFAAVPTLGGTAVRASIALDHLGISSTVHLVSTNRVMRAKLPQRVTVHTSATSDSWEPHLIVQYPAGEGVSLIDGDLRAPSANRIILVHDLPNEEMRLGDALEQSLSRAETLLVSGFNAMRDPDLAARRGARVRRGIESAPRRPFVFYEDAGFHSDDVWARFTAAFCGVADVHSMNEDELRHYAARELDVLDAAAVRGALEQVRRFRLGSVLVLHTKHYALACGPGAARFGPALEAATNLASARYLYGDEISAQSLREVGSLPSQPAGIAFCRQWTHGDDSIALPAKIVATPTPTTVGLGDTFVAGFLSAVHTSSTAPDPAVEYS